MPVMMEVYTPRFYLEQMESAGYIKEIDWFAFLVGQASVPMRDIFLKIKDRLIRQGFVFRTINMKRFDEEVESIKELANTAWDENWGHVPYTERQLDHLAKALKLLIDPRLVYMVEKDGKVIGVSVTLPDVNPSVKKMNGRLFPFGWWHFLRAKKNASGLRTFLLGVAPEFRMKGIDAAMITETVLTARQLGYEWSDCSLIVETNRAMIDPILKWGGQVYRTYRIFSKML
jgi:GNAT superfamily N-acetyltransferase